MNISENIEKPFFNRIKYVFILFIAFLIVVQANVFAKSPLMTVKQEQVIEPINKANYAVQGTQYTITLSQFSPSQLLQIQGFLRTYSAYKSDSIIAQNSISTQMSYHFGDSKALLLSNIRKTAEHLGLQILLRSASNDIDIRLVEVNAKNIPYKQW